MGHTLGLTYEEEKNDFFFDFDFDDFDFEKTSPQANTAAPRYTSTTITLTS